MRRRAPASPGEWKLGRHIDLYRVILAEAGRVTLVGVLLGLAMGLAAGGFLEGLPFGVELHDPVTLAATVASVALVALVAAWLPARRAASIDPMRALRFD